MSTDLIVTLVTWGYLVTCLVAARIIYTKWYNEEWFIDADHQDIFFATVGGSLFWPVALLLWGVVRFITGGVRK